MKRLLLILLLCNIGYGAIDKVDNPELPFDERYVSDPNYIGSYMRELVKELESVLTGIQDAVNHLISLNQPAIRYFATPDADNEYADGTWRIVQVGTDDFEMQKKISGTWTMAGKWSYGDGLDIAGNKVRIRTLLTPDTASGSAGQIAWDTDYLYVCVATNDWRRIVLAHFDSLLLETGDHLLLENGSLLLLE